MVNLQKKRNSKIVATDRMYLLLPFVFLVLSSKVGAVDILFYKSAGGCSGSAVSFYGARQQLCYSATALSIGSVLFTNSDACKTGYAYSDGGCNTPIVSAPGNFCFGGFSIVSGKWYQSCRRRLLLSDVPSNTTKCDGTVQKPNGVVYTEDSKTGSWMIKSPDALELFSQLESLPEEEKVAWLKAQYASHDKKNLREG